jgi:hypothetical protein
MSEKLSYRFKYVSGSLARIQSQWSRFQNECVDDSSIVGPARFIPARGGCFVVIEDYNRPGWRTALAPGRTIIPAPDKLLEGFDRWLSVQR